MSSHINRFLDSIPLNQSISQMQAAIIGNLLACGWQQVATSDGAWTDVIPPVTETIGTSKFREVTRLYFTDSKITIGSYMACIADAIPQAVRLTAKTAGAVACAVTLEGATVTGAAGSSSSTANDNLRALYYALRDSADATIQGWSYVYNGSDTLVCTRKAIAAAVTCSGNANVNFFTHASPVLAGARSAYATNDAAFGYSVNVDLASGFVYYLQVFSRTIRLSTKCLTGTTGAVFASYIDHAEALAQVPGPGCTPIELVIGNENTGNATATGRVTHWWGMPMANGYRAPAFSESSYPSIASPYWIYDPDWHPFSGRADMMALSDVGLLYSYDNGGVGQYAFSSALTLGKCGSQTGSSRYDEFRVAPLGTPGGGGDLLSGYQNSHRVYPGFNLPDVFKWSGSEPNEASAWCAVPAGLASTSYTLQTAMDASSTYSSLTLNTTAGLPTTGSVQIGLERFDYTGTSGATITGVTRSAGGTAKERHFVGDAVLPGQWFLKVNTSALACGPLQPA